MFDGERGRSNRLWGLVLCVLGLALALLAALPAAASADDAAPAESGQPPLITHLDPADPPAGSSAQRGGEAGSSVQRGEAAGPRIASRSLEASRSGLVPVRIACAATTPGACDAEVELRGGRRAGGRRELHLGRAAGAIPAGRVGIVRLRLSRRARSLLRQRGRLSVSATVAWTAPGGEPVARRRTLTLHG